MEPTTPNIHKGLPMYTLIVKIMSVRENWVEKKLKDGRVINSNFEAKEGGKMQICNWFEDNQTLLSIWQSMWQSDLRLWWPDWE